MSTAAPLQIRAGKPRPSRTPTHAGSETLWHAAQKQPAQSHATALEGSARAQTAVRLRHDFSMMRVHSGPAAPRSAGDVIPNTDMARLSIAFGEGRLVPRTHEPGLSTVPLATRDLLSRAAEDAAQPLPGALQDALADRVMADFSRLRVHSGATSAAAAERLGARAYTLGRSIHLGAEAGTMAAPERDRLLAHEAVHAVQQGLSPVRPHGGLRVGRPDSAAEAEARSIAASVSAPAASASLAVRDRLCRATPVRHRAEPQIQCDLKGPYKGIDGTFNLNLKTESHPGAKNGMSGTIKFKASSTSPDATKIRLLQIARLEDFGTGKDYKWTGDEANRMKVMTTAAPSVDPGFFVDVIHKNRSPRAAKGDAPVSPYYIDDYKALASPNNTDGSKKGKAITEASLWDYPGWGKNCRFSFETAAQSTDNGYVYATVSWGFTISDAAKGKVDKEHAALNEFPTATFGAAVKSFHEFYKNPGASTAPK